MVLHLNNSKTMIKHMKASVSRCVFGSWSSCLVVVALGLWMVTEPVLAQSKLKQLWERRDSVHALVDSAVSARYFSVRYDTAYIKRPDRPLTVKIRTNLSGNVFNIKQHGDVEGRGKLRSQRRATLSLGVNYKGLGASFALNPASLKGKNKDFEINMNIYKNRFGIDFVYQDTRTLSGDLRYGDLQGTLDKGVLRMKMVNVNGYYVFNGRKFSYPAAFVQSFVQRRSAGSWLAGFSYMGGRMKTTDDKPEVMPNYRVYVGHFGIGGGYGYNLVGCHGRLLMHISALPTLVIGNYSNVRVEGERKDIKARFPEVILTGRAAVVYNLSDKYFLSSTFVITNSTMGDDQLDIRFSKWYARACFGIRLWKKT